MMRTNKNKKKKTESLLDPSLLWDAFFAVEQERYDALPPDSEIGWNPSEKFEKQMTRLIRAQRNPYWRLVNTVGKRVACIALAALLAFGGAMSVEAVRDTVVSFVIEIFEKYSIVTVPADESSTAPQTIETVYTFPAEAIPAGFVKTEEEIDRFDHIEKYHNADGQILYLRQSITVNISVVINTEGVETHSITVGDASGFYYFNKGYNNIYWLADGYLFLIYTDSGLDNDELATIGASVMPKK